MYNFKKFIFKKGFLIKNTLKLSKIFKKINMFLYFNKSYLNNNYAGLSWYFDNIYNKNINYINILNSVFNLIKPPFIVKSMSIPKKLKKQIKVKYFIKIVYNKENKRIYNSYKQIYFYSNKFFESKFETRLYKALIFTFLD